MYKISVLYTYRYTSKLHKLKYSRITLWYMHYHNSCIKLYIITKHTEHCKPITYVVEIPN